MNRKDFQRLSVVRLNEAQALLDAGLPDGAYYLAGYSVECALKACIAKRTQRHDFPERDRVMAAYTHNLERLITEAKLDELLIEEMRASSEFEKNWRYVRSWTESSRYDFIGPGRAADLLGAVAGRTFGVLRWLKRFW